MKNKREDGSEAVNASVRRVMALDLNPEEALYKWIDMTLGIKDDGKGGVSTRVDAFPAYMNTQTADVFCTAVLLMRSELQKFPKGRCALCGMAKYDVESGAFIEAILLDGYPADMRDGIKQRIEAAFAIAKTNEGLFSAK